MEYITNCSISIKLNTATQIKRNGLPTYVDNIDETEMCYTQWKKLESNVYIMYNSVYMTFFQRQKYRTKHRLPVARCWELAKS